MKFLALVGKLFIEHEDNIIYLSNDNKIFVVLKIHGMCLEISSMCPEIRMVHKDCAIFYLMTQKLPRWLKVSYMCPKI